MVQKRLLSVCAYMKNHAAEFDEHITMSDILRINQQDATRGRHLVWRAGDACIAMLTPADNSK